MEICKNHKTSRNQHALAVFTWLKLQKFYVEGFHRNIISISDYIRIYNITQPYTVSYHHIHKSFAEKLACKTKFTKL